MTRSLPTPRQAQAQRKKERESVAALEEFVLARLCERKRAVLEAPHSFDKEYELADLDSKKRMAEESFGGVDAEEMWLLHLQLLALPFTHHPLYREEWKPFL